LNKSTLKCRFSGRKNRFEISSFLSEIFRWIHLNLGLRNQGQLFSIFLVWKVYSNSLCLCIPFWSYVVFISISYFITKM
jgi:hypothetical protein